MGVCGCWSGVTGRTEGQCPEKRRVKSQPASPRPEAVQLFTASLFPSLTLVLAFHSSFAEWGQSLAHSSPRAHSRLMHPGVWWEGPVLRGRLGPLMNGYQKIHCAEAPSPFNRGKWTLGFTSSTTFSTLCLTWDATSGLADNILLDWAVPATHIARGTLTREATNYIKRETRFKLPLPCPLANLTTPGYLFELRVSCPSSSPTAARVTSTPPSGSEPPPTVCYVNGRSMWFKQH